MEGQGSSGAFAFSAVDGNEEERAKQEGHNPACQGIQTSERTPPGGCLKGPVLTTLCKNICSTPSPMACSIFTHHHKFLASPPACRL